MDKTLKNPSEGTDRGDEKKEKDKKLFFFVNRMRFDEDQGVKPIMTTNEIAGLVGLTDETAIVRRLLHGNDSSEPLSGEQKIEKGDQFSVTRRRVEGGLTDRIERELQILREGEQLVELIRDPVPCVLYRALPSQKNPPLVDVIVPIPTGYPAAMIDRAGLPADSPLVSQVKGSPQEVVQIAGRSWRMISYHPHNGGGAPPWNPSKHGFHTYLSEILSWLEVMR